MLWGEIRPIVGSANRAQQKSAQRFARALFSILPFSMPEFGAERQKLFSPAGESFPVRIAAE
jgi:hypothetical protein